MQEEPKTKGFFFLKSKHSFEKSRFLIKTLDFKTKKLYNFEHNSTLEIDLLINHKGKIIAVVRR